ncbi:NADH:flavin oxidoreductase [Rhabdothermincola salaria]|uniref:NADH:flavin oxidoreductase n=1 Tax=Rhabdothermincola salaria TaxID=2903142 RepID=UPI001E4E29ED|nr:NADH:flavin oxidoreductase [Rhabdothermincola salaria]MCD9623665.1 NADH:flavin oxidoreductase [Rhabdothermincola salaria]
MTDTTPDRPVTATPPDPFAPATLGPLSLRNRVVKAATFEGVVPEALVTDELVEFHRRPAAGGVGMTTVAYLAVSPEGRTHAECIWLRPEAVPGLARLADVVHAEGAKVSAQIGHAGPVANAKSNRATALAPSRSFNPVSMKVTRAVTDDDITRITLDYQRGARLVAEAGFDAIEIHLAHNYLLSSFLSPKFNKRTDRWGGSLENRARFARQVVRAVREAVGDGLAVTAKVSLDDGVPGGFRLPESAEFSRMLEEDGCLDALELTGGSSLANPMYLFRGDAPREDFAATLPPLQRFGFKLIAGKMMPAYPFEEAYFLGKARQVRDAVDMPLILLGGINTRATIERAMAEGFQFVAMGRALLREPDLLARMQSGDQLEGNCIHCNRCMPSIYSGSRCVLDHPEPIVVPAAHTIR